MVELAAFAAWFAAKESNTTLRPPATPLSMILELIVSVALPSCRKSSACPAPDVNWPWPTRAPTSLPLMSAPVSKPPVVSVSVSVLLAKLMTDAALMMDSVLSVTPPVGSMIEATFRRASTPVGTLPVVIVVRLTLRDWIPFPTAVPLPVLTAKPGSVTWPTEVSTW